MLKLRKGRRPFVPVALGGGAFIRVRPATQLDAEIASSKATPIVAGLAVGSEGAAELAEVLGDEFNLAALEAAGLRNATLRLCEVYLVLRCQDGWTGVATEDGEVIPQPDAATLALLMADPIKREAVMSVINSSIHEETDEKNGSTASPNGGAGILAGAPIAANAAIPAPTEVSSEGPAGAPGALKSKTHH